MTWWTDLVLLAMADLDGDNTDMPMWFQVLFVGVIVVIICFVAWTFLPVRRRQSRQAPADAVNPTEGGSAEAGQ